MSPLKNIGKSEKHDGSDLRIAIVHARWNATLIDALVTGAKKTLLAAGVKAENISVSSVPGSYELPLAVQRVYAASTVQASTAGTLSASDLLSSMSSTDLISDATGKSSQNIGMPIKSAFDAVIAIGVLIKGETMHFEYIADAVSHGLMRVQLDSGVPVIFGLLTVLNEEQGKARAGVDGKGHNHGEDWGDAAVELAVKRNAWTRGEGL